MKNLVSSYTRLVWVVYSGEVGGGVVTRCGMCCVGCVVWVHGYCYILFQVNIVGSIVSSYVSRYHRSNYIYLEQKIAEPMYPHHPSYKTHARSGINPTSYLPTVTTHTSRVQLLTKFFIYQPEDGQRTGPKHVVVLCVTNYTYLYHHTAALHSTHTAIQFIINTTG